MHMPTSPFDPQNQRYRDYSRPRQMTLGDLLLENRIVFLGSSPETGGQAAITDYLANVMQHSGEDWSQVKMTLSTAQPMLNASPPELCMLEPVLVTRGKPGAPPMPGGGGFGSPFANPIPPGDISGKAKASRGAASQLSSGQGKGGLSYSNQKEAERLLNEAAAIEQNLDLMRAPAEVAAEA